MDTSKSCSSSLQLQVVLSAPDLSFQRHALGKWSALSITRLRLWVNVTYLACGVWNGENIASGFMHLLELIVFKTELEGDTVCCRSLIKTFYAFLSMVMFNDGAGMGSVLWKDTTTTRMTVKGHTLAVLESDLSNNCCIPVCFFQSTKYLFFSLGGLTALIQVKRIILCSLHLLNLLESTKWKVREGLKHNLEPTSVQSFKEVVMWLYGISLLGCGPDSGQCSINVRANPIDWPKEADMKYSQQQMCYN